MKNLFSLEGPVLRFLLKCGQLILLGVCWFVCSLPLVTVGMSTTALMRSCFDLREDKEDIFKTFFKTYLSKWKVSSLAFLVIAGFFILLYCIPQVTAFLGIDILSILAIGITSAAYLLLWLVLSCVFPVAAYFDTTPEKTMRNALFVALRDRRQSIPVAIVSAIPVVLFLALPEVFDRTLWLWLVVYPGICGYFTACRFAPVFLAYGDKKEKKEEETSNETL